MIPVLPKLRVGLLPKQYSVACFVFILYCILYRIVHFTLPYITNIPFNYSNWRHFKCMRVFCTNPATIQSVINACLVSRDLHRDPLVPRESNLAFHLVPDHLLHVRVVVRHRTAHLPPSKHWKCLFNYRMKALKTHSAGSELLTRDLTQSDPTWPEPKYVLKTQIHRQKIHVTFCMTSAT